MLMKRMWLMAVMVCGLSACVTPPPGLERNEFTIQSVKKIEPSDYECQCKEVRLGGKVLSATALKDQTKIEVLSLPVRGLSAKPSIDGAVEGRFIAYLPGFIDPEYLKDQFITVAGKLINQEKGKIDQADYWYPVVDVIHYKRWKLVQEYYYEPDDWDYWGYGRFGWSAHFWRPEPRLRYHLY
ncbi:Slp family lipoprotein [[Pasteurella] aerogenes]